MQAVVSRPADKINCEQYNVICHLKLELLKPAAKENPYLYAGREVDILDGGMLKLQINRHRILNYPLARWMQPDPLGVVPNDYYNPFRPKDQLGDGVNIYQYCGGNPIDMLDALGLWRYAKTAEERAKETRTFVVADSIGEMFRGTNTLAAMVRLNEDEFDKWGERAIAEMMVVVKK